MDLPSNGFRDGRTPRGLAHRFLDWAARVSGGGSQATENANGVTGPEHSGQDGKSDRPRLAFYIPNLSVGGAEQVTVDIVNGLAARGQDVELIISHATGELLPKVSDEVRVTILGSTRLPVVGIVAHVPALARYLRRVEPAAIFPQMTHASVTCLAARRLVDVETAVFPTKHCAFGESDEVTLKSEALRRLATALFPTADGIIGVSRGVADSLIEKMDLDPDRVSVLHNPVEIESIRERANQPVDHEWVEDDDVDIVLFVGRLERQKDLETWLRTFARVQEQNPDTRGIVAGKGSQREALQSLAAELGIEDVVSIPGYVENPYRFMHKASTFLLTSRYEGLPTVIIEALACGCPVVATDCPSGPREILAEGEYGQLAAVGDVDGLADAVVQTLADPLPAAVLRGRAENFAPDPILDEYERFIRTHVLEKRPVPEAA
ncbi:glycosyltransferase [Halobellus rarus]|uniref:Glycosyltransferase n=1 Tax=Halobellus rarus TaxID=1126237 RepID=A0ABD6CS63_9EURY|nr:glycosyltransferase [Halobellus rarus]